MVGTLRSRIGQALIVVALVSCGDDGGVQTFNITPDGGDVSLENGAVLIHVPVGAVSNSVTVTASPNTSGSPPDPRKVGSYDISLSDTVTFLQPVTVKLKMGFFGAITTRDYNTAAIYKDVGGNWVKVAGTTYNPADTSISADVTTFSTYAVFLGNVGPAGNTAVLANGAVEVTVPPGALTEPQVLDAQAGGGGASNRMVTGTNFTLTPSLALAPNGTLRLTYNPANIPSFVQETSLGVFVSSGASWSRVPGGSINTANDAVTAPIGNTGGVYSVQGDSTGGGGPVNPGSKEPANFTLITDRPFVTKTEMSWLDRGDAAFTIATDATAPFPPGGTTVGIATYPLGYIGGAGPINTRRPIDSFGYSNLYIGFWMKLSSNWQGHSTGVNKIFFIWIANEPRIFFNARGSGNGPYTPIVNMQSVPDTRNTLNPNVTLPTPLINRGQWHFFEVLLISSSPGGANGTVRWWLDGVEVAHYTDARMLDAGESRTWQEVSWNPTWGGAGDATVAIQDMRMDNIRVSGQP